MDLKEFTSGTPTTKPWLNIVAHDVKTETLSADTAAVADLAATDIEASILSLRDTGSVPNPPIGEVSFFSTGSTFKATNPLGGTVSFLTSAGPGSGVMTSGSVVAGNIPSFIDPNTIQDSGLSKQGITDDSIAVEALQSQAEPVAPRGQRDLWQYGGAGGAGPELLYVPAIDRLYSFGNVAGFSSSKTQGTTWLTPTFDIAPADPAIVGSNGIKVVSVGQFGTENYISPDGDNFFQNPPLPTSTSESFNVDYFAAAGLYVTGVNVDPTHRIMTSPDGITWTVQAAPGNATTIHSHDSICVAVGQVAPFSIYSTDGVTWTGTPSTITGCRSVSWNDDRKEWLAIGYSDGIGYRSTDGINWVSLGVIAPLNVNAHAWVSKYGQYYLTKADTSGNYSLWTTPDPTRQAFVGTHLDGAVAQPLAYGLVYIPSVDRFGIGANNAPYFAYGTVRNDIKALTDNIRVRGFPVRVACYSTDADVVVNNTTTETVISGGGIGSPTFQAGQPLGMRQLFDLNMVATSAAGDTLTIRYKLNGTTKLTHTLAIPAATTPINIDTRVTLRSGNMMQINSFQLISALSLIITDATQTYTNTQLNAWTVTAQWGANVNQLTVNEFSLCADFINGA